MTTTDEHLIPELREYREEFVEIIARATRLAKPLTEEQFLWKAGLDRWSVAECLEHLNTVGRKLLPRLERAIEEGRASGKVGVPPFRYGIVSRWFIRGNEPTGVKMQTFSLYQPDPGRLPDKSAVMRAFTATQERFKALTENANGLDLRRIRVASPVSSILRISLGAWFAATVAHENRHLSQAERVIQEPGFPRR